MTNTVERAIDQICFSVEETVRGTPVFPSSAAQMIVTAGPADINQQPSFSDSEEFHNTLDLLERFQDQTGPGSWAIPMYVRPSGTAGTEPMGEVLFKSLTGKETIVASTSVTYGLAKTKPSFTMWAKKGDTVYFGAGACAETCRLNFVNKGAAKIEMSGGFMRMGWAGKSAVSGAVSLSNTVGVANAKLFTKDSYVQIGSDTNSDNGYRIESIDYDTNTLTMVDTLSCSDGAEIKGFLPAYPAIGTPLENKTLQIKFDGVKKNVKSLNVEINSPVAWQADEITSSGYAEEYVEDQRAIKVSAEILQRTQDLEYFYNGINNKKTNVVAVLSGGDGKTCTVNLPFTEFEVPNIQTEKPTIKLSVSGTALGSVGEDSCSIVFT